MTQTSEPRTRSAAVAVAGLRIEGVRKAYGAVEVLHGVDLTVAPGALTAVLGRSGCGKSTLLRLVAGFDDPDAGTVAIAGRRVAGPGPAVPPEARHVGYVTQDGNLFPHLTVAANIAFGMPRRSRHRVAELLELVGLEQAYAQSRPHELSGGQQQRVALARALAPEPGLLLLDEPFSALDVDLRESTRRAVLAALSAAGTTTVLVTHDQAEALSVAGRVAVMRDGRIVQEASPGELYRHPVDRDVAAFVGDVVVLPAVLARGVATSALGRLRVAPGASGDGPATVLVRPEQIVLGDVGVPADVVAVDYFGHDAVLRLHLGAAGEVTARCPGYAVPEVGTQVQVAVHGQVGVEADPPTGR